MAATHAGCEPAGAQPQTELLRIGLAQAPGALDPATDRTEAGLAVLANLCDTLIRLDADGWPAPGLAKDWRFAPDGQVLTLTLRADAGIDADAAAASLQRARTLPHSARRGELAPVVSVEPQDARTLRLVLDRPFVPLLAQLAGRAGMVATEVSDDGGDARCAGPYRIDARRADGTIALARIDGHRDRADYAFVRIEFVPVADPVQRLARLRTGALDIFAGVSPEDAADLAGDRRVRVAEGPAQGWRALLFNLRAGPFAGDTGAAARARVAGALVGAAPNGAGLAFGLIVPVEHDNLATAREILARTEAAGFAPRLRTLAPLAAAQRVQNGDFDAALATWPGRADPDGDFHAQFHCRGARNDTGYCAPGVDAALDAARAETDPAKRAALYATVRRQIDVDRPAIFLEAARRHVAYSARLTGVTPSPDGIVRVRGVAAVP